MSEHKIGWFRSFYYYMGWEYESENDKPTEESVKKKQVLMKLLLKRKQILRK